MVSIRRMIRAFFRTLLLSAGVVAALVAGIYLYMTSGRYVTTENAYVKAPLIIVTAEVSGLVTGVAVRDNQAVRAGQILFRIDTRRFEVERDRRAAELRAARQRVEALRARYRTKLAALSAADGDARFLQAELDRTRRLRARGTISEFKLIEAQRNSAKALTARAVAHEEAATALAELGGDTNTPTDSHPDVLRARAELKRAEIDLAAAVVRAPGDAIAAHVKLQSGEYVKEGQPVLSLVVNKGFWVEANVKETDLTNLKIGQHAILTVDAYPGLEWKAKVASLSPATGAEYALLPPQNASGNWVKVVQRVPVRLEIESPKGAPQLRAGMSVAVSIDTRHERALPDVLNKARAWMRTDSSR